MNLLLGREECDGEIRFKEAKRKNEGVSGG